ncbi:MAG TPA: hypothetical protein VFI47_29105 [Acidimicrobiales bacterium]|nr:hypothetical protein [Acidimicrobiales bacterium]
MKAAAAVVVAGATTLGVLGLAELTQNRPDPVAADTETVVEFDVATRGYRGGDGPAAQALWAVCSATVPGEVSGVAGASAGEFAVTVRPAIGENGRKRLLGCLEDGTLDRVLGHVRRVSDR